MAKIPVQSLLLKAQAAFPSACINERRLGLAVKTAFPEVKRQHTKGGPYSYYGLKGNVNIPADSIQKDVQSNKNAVEVGCQATDSMAYDFSRYVPSGIPKDRFLERDVLQNLIEGDTVLGEGTFSFVKIMQYRKLAVAVKEFKEIPEFSPKRIIDRAVGEARTLINISPHESIPMLYGIIINSRPIALVLQLCTRNNVCLNFSRVIRNGGLEDVTEECFLEILVKLASALHHVHKNGFVHNDLKVDNVAIMKTTRGKNAKEWIPVILDFGEATRIGNDFKRRYRSFHSHIDPEVLSGNAIHTIRTDIYSFGVILRGLMCIFHINEIKDSLNEIFTKCTSAGERPSLEEVKKILSHTLHR